MKIEEFASLNRSWDKTIKRVGDYYFCKQRDAGYPIAVYSAFPLNQKVKVDRQFIKELKRKFLITQILLDLPKKDIYEYVLTTDNYSLDQFNGNQRHRIRKCQKIFSFRNPSLEDLLQEGLAINRQTIERQSRTDSKLTDSKLWTRYVHSIYNDSRFTILGAYRENLMVAYLVVYNLEGKFNLVEAFIDRNQAKGASPMRGLLYTLINNLTGEYGKITISYGFHKFSRPTSLTRFKETMHFERFSYAKAYVVNPVLQVALGLLVFVLIKLLHRKTFKRKWTRATIKLYQGHRRLKEAA